MVWRLVLTICLVVGAAPIQFVAAQEIATTTMRVSICGNSIVDAGEECDVPGETGVYSTTIAGRQCSAICEFGPYCGDGILQTLFGEQCDDGNNNNGDFCSADCTIEPAGSGGGGSSGGGSARSGGSNEDLGDTQIRVTGIGYPNSTVNILLDSEDIGDVRTNSRGEFEFATDASPGTATMGFWANDPARTRSVTFNTTFDVTQGAITNLSNLLLPPTISVSDQTVDQPGQVVTVTGYAPPNVTVELVVGQSDTPQATSVSGSSGQWSIDFDTSSLSIAEHILRARYQYGSPPLVRDSNFSSSLQLFVGVEGSPAQPSDLNRDGSVNLTDFSILIFWWQTNGGQSDPPADISGNGNVGLEDFSILLFNWTG